MRRARLCCEMGIVDGNAYDYAGSSLLCCKPYPTAEAKLKP